MVTGQSGLALMPRVRFIVERRVRYEPAQGWVWEQKGDEFATPEQAREFERGLHMPVSETRRRPVLIR